MCEQEGGGREPARSGRQQDLGRVDPPSLFPCREREDRHEDDRCRDHFVAEDEHWTSPGRFVADGRIEPRRYVAETDWQSNRRTVHLGFADGGRYDLQQRPPPEPDPDIEGGLPEMLPHGIVDPLSLAVAAGRALQQNGRCDQTVPVFDGRRRFDVIVKHVDEATLPPSSYSVYQGPAVRCSFRMERISGFRKSWRARGRWDADSSAPPTIWVASIRQDLPPVPVRYDGTIALGNIVVHLTRAEVRAEPAGQVPGERASQ